MGNAAEIFGLFFLFFACGLPAEFNNAASLFMYTQQHTLKELRHQGLVL